MVVIVTGTLNTGIQTIHGPFRDCEQADAWAKSEKLVNTLSDQFIGHLQYAIVPLRSLDQV